MRSPALRLFVLAAVAGFCMAMSLSSSAGIFVSVNIAPPPLPVYAQPMIPGPGYIWTPGYWSYDDDGYFWVPGTWILPPFVGALWTPGYWGWNNGLYAFNAGYWDTSVGFYGGIDYGYGYGGHGYDGGYWTHGAFNYNRSVNNINTRYIHNVYDRPVNHGNYNRISYNGGHGGVMARPAPGQSNGHGRRVPAIAAQQQQVRMASRDRASHTSVNHGAPALTATPRAGDFSARPHAANPAPRTAAAARSHDNRVPNTSTRPNAGNAQRSAQYSHATPERNNPASRNPTRSMRPEHAESNSYQQARPESHRGESRSYQQARPTPHPGESRSYQQARPAPHSGESRSYQQARPAPHSGESRSYQQARPAPTNRGEASSHAPARSSHQGDHGGDRDDRGHQH